MTGAHDGSGGTAASSERPTHGGGCHAAAAQRAPRLCVLEGSARDERSGLPGAVRGHGCPGAETASLGTRGGPPVAAAVGAAVGRLQCGCASSPRVCQPQEQGPESQVFPPGEGLPEPPLDSSRLWRPVGRDDRTKGAPESVCVCVWWGESQAGAPGPPWTSLGPRTSPLTLRSLRTLVHMTNAQGCAKLRHKELYKLSRAVQRLNYDQLSTY